ncbi:hypothetical protein ACQKWADRAFT_297406 [Trichoderma austrokoningii]
MRPGIAVSSKSCQPQHGAAPFWPAQRCFRRRLTSAKEVFHDRQTALWTSCSILFFIHLQYLLSFLRLCAGPPGVSRTFLSIRRNERDLSQTCRAELCLGTLRLTTLKGVESWDGDSGLPSWRSFVVATFCDSGRFGMKQLPNSSLR